MTEKTLASELRNNLVALNCLVFHLEKSLVDPFWEQVFRNSALETLPEIEKLLREFPRRSEINE